ncbi:MAG: nucleoside deaminase [Oscillospiraceae bacterium]|nr:nucleoside deaminase [Oscillospiraceae bacterium]
MNDESFMRRALELARQAADEGETPVGCVIVKDGEIIAEGYNKREQGKNALYHAEMIAIDAACKALGGWRLWQCELFVTLEPCPMCAGAIANAHIPRVVFAASDNKHASYKTRMEGGLLADESAALLKDFFVKLRNS